MTIAPMTLMRPPIPPRALGGRARYPICGAGNIEMKSASRPVSRVLYGPHRCPDVAAIPLGPPLPAASSNQPGRQRRRHARTRLAGPPGRPYSVLLPAGLAMPLPLPEARCALTAPFHPCPACAGRFAFCGAVPGVAPAGRYPAPCLRGARTFLHPKHRLSKQRPPGRLAAAYVARRRRGQPKKAATRPQDALKEKAGH